MTSPSGFEQLKDFPTKINPTGADILYAGDSTNNFNEVKVTIDNLLNYAPQAHFARYIATNAATYTNGTITQSGNIVTGISTVFTSTGLKGGQLIVTSNGSYMMVNTVVNDTTLIVDTSASIVTPESYTMYYNGFQIDNLGRGSATNFNLSPLLIPVAKNSDFTVSDTECVYNIDTTAGDVTVSLLAANVLAGKYYVFKKASVANNVIVISNGAELIDGSISQTLLGSYSSITIVSDGVSNWSIIAKV